MTKLKKLLLLCGALALSVGMATLTACGEDSPTGDNSTSTPQESSPAPQPAPEPLPEEGYYYLCYERVEKTVPANTNIEIIQNLPQGLYCIFPDMSGSTTVNGYDKYMLEVGEDGVANYTISYQDFFLPEGEEVTASYAIYKIFPVDTDGPATLFSYGTTPIEITLPEVGAYTLTTDTEVSFYAAANFESYISDGTSHILAATQPNEKVTVYVSKYSDFDDYELVYSVEPMESESITESTKSLALTHEGSHAYSFTATQHGAYKVSYDFNRFSVGLFDPATASIDYYHAEEYVEFDYTGAPVILFARADTENASSLSVTIERIGDAGYRTPTAPDPLYLLPEEIENSNTGIVPANSETYGIPLLVYANNLDGNWKLTWDNANVALYTENGSAIENGHLFEGKGNSSMTGQYVCFYAHNATDEAQTVTFTLTEVLDERSVLTLSEEGCTFDLTDSSTGIMKVSFTANEGGTYAFNSTDGDVFSADPATGADPIDTIELSANETVILYLAYKDYSDTVVTVYVTKA